MKHYKSVDLRISFPPEHT